MLTKTRLVGTPAVPKERILVLDDDTRVFLAVARSLGRRGYEVHAAPSDRGAAALASRYIAKVHRLPSYHTASDSWARTLRALIADFDIKLVVPCSDASLSLLRRYADLFDSRMLALPPGRPLSLFSDKAETRRLAEESGVPIVRGRLVREEDRATELVREFGLPLVLKPRMSCMVGEVRKRFVYIIADAGKLAEALPEAAAGGFLCETFFFGIGVGLSVLAKGGKTLAACQHERLHEVLQGGSSSRVSRDVDPSLRASVDKLVEASDLTGVAMFEFRQDPASREAVLLEVNPRFWGSLPLALVSGADYPADLCDILLNDASPQSGPFRAGVRKRDLEGEYERLLRLLGEADGKLRKLLVAATNGTMFVARLANGRMFDSWAKDDPKPWRAERRLLLRRIGASFAKRCRRAPAPALPISAPLKP